MRRSCLVLAVAAVALAGCAAATPRGLSAPGVVSLAAPAGPAAPSGLPAPADLPAVSGWTDALVLTPISPAVPVAPPPLRVGGPWISHVSLLGGGRWLDKDWDPIDKQLTYGLEVDESEAASGNGYEVGALYAHDEDDIEATTYELYGGYRYTFGDATQDVHPFLSLGVSALNSELELGDSDDDTIFGAYARAGLLWDVSERVRLGLDYRHLFAQDFEWEVGGVEVSADGDYDQVLLSLGFEF